MNIISRLSATAAFVTLMIASPALAQTATIDFSGHGTGGQIGNTYASLGVNFSTAAFFQCGGGCPAPTPNGYFAYDNGNPFTAFFSNAQSMVSFQYVTGSSTLAQAFDASNNLVASFGHDESYPDDNVVGTLSGADITKVLFSDYDGSQNGPAITNLTFNTMAAAVPEPASWAMMILGMGAVGFALRSAKRRSEEKFETKIKKITYGAVA